MANDTILRQTTANALASKLYEDRMLKQGQAGRSVSDGGGNIHEAALKMLASNSGNPSVTLQQRSQLLGSSPGLSQGSQGKLAGFPGVNQVTSAQLQQLKGWPGLSNPAIFQSPRGYPQFHALSPAQQQQVLNQAQAQQQQQGSGVSNQSSSQSLMTDLTERRLRHILTSKNSAAVAAAVAAGKVDGLVDNLGSPGSLQRSASTDQELLMKLQARGLGPQAALQQLQQQQQQQQSASQSSQQQGGLQGRPLQGGDQQSQGGPGDGSNFRGGETGGFIGGEGPTPSGTSTGAVKAGSVKSGPNSRKRKPAPASSSAGPANSTGTTNTGPSPSSNPPTPTNHLPGDVSSVPGMGGLVNSGSVSGKHGILYGGDGIGATLNSPANQLNDIDRYNEEASLDDDNVSSFLSENDDPHPQQTLFGNSKRSPAGHNIDTKGFSFSEVDCLHASTSKVVCCHFSSDGKLLASAGHDKKAMLWSMESFKLRSTLEEHSMLITDVRFSPSSSRLATSSFDKTVRVWDAENPNFSLRTFSGHQTAVMSLDFHPTNEDLLCSCDGDSEMRYWSINQGICNRVFKGATTQMRFQPRTGRLLAAAAENIVSIFDVESETLVHQLQRHTKPVHSVCWDATGDFVASVSEDSVRVWALGAGSGGECVHDLISSGNKFHSCVFHPKYPSLLVIGCYQSLELWNMVENKSMTVQAHDGLIAALSQSAATGMMASASHDKTVKLWT